MEQNTGVQEQDLPSQENTALAAVGYLPMMFFLPLLVGGQDDFARFHGKQSLLLFLGFFVAWMGIWVIDLLFGRMMGSIILLGFIFKAVAWFVHNLVGMLVSLLYIGLMIAGMVQAATGRYWQVPWLGSYAARFGNRTGRP